MRQEQLITERVRTNRVHRWCSSSHTRRLAATLGAGLCTLLMLASAGSLVAPAQAAETAKLQVQFSPYKLGASTTLAIKLWIANTDGGVPSAVTGFDTQLPSALELVGSSLGLAVCHATNLLEDGLSGCSPNAQLGSGTATVEVPFGPEVVTEQANLQVLMGPSINEQVGVLLYAESRTPVSAQLVFPGEVYIGAKDEETLDTTFPPTPTLPGAPDAAASYVQLRVGPEHLTYYRWAHGKRISYRPNGATLPTVCPRGGFRFVTALTFLDGTNLKAPYTVPCPPSSRSVHHRRHGRGGHG
jgi:hypothetical protein